MDKKTLEIARLKFGAALDKRLNRFLAEFVGSLQPFEQKKDDSAKLVIDGDLGGSQMAEAVAVAKQRRAEWDTAQNIRVRAVDAANTWWPDVTLFDEIFGELCDEKTDGGADTPDPMPSDFERLADFERWDQARYEQLKAAAGE